MFAIQKSLVASKLFNSMGFKDFDNTPLEMGSVQSYNPMYSIFFPKEPSMDTLSLNHKYHIYDHTNVVDAKGKVKPCKIFIKHSPLLDPVHYLVGKYRKETEKIPILPLPDHSNKDLGMEKVFDPNNASYVDNFFNYLSSQMLHNHNLHNGIDYYGSNLVIQPGFRFNVYDDITYLQESEYFLKNNHKTYMMEDIQTPILTSEKNTQSKRPKLRIDDEEPIDIGIEDIICNDDSYNDVESESKNEMITEYLRDKSDDIDEDNNSEVSNSSAGSSDGSDCNNTDDEENDDDDDDDDDDDEQDEDDDEDDDETEELYAYLYDFPVQMIALEQCDGTLDSLLEEKTLNNKEIAAALLQVIFTLIVYQKSFSFTHNDLHTNNIVFKQTDLKFLSYQYNGKHYKVPTYGRIYKIIDFGRSIYRYQDKILCSDSFAPGGDANGQYNSEPYFNSNKPRLEPSPGFDLCRLGCSLYDFMFEDEEDEFNPDPKKMSALQKTVHRWCQDDYGKNILYKRNGDERYPHFKLYKMISRMAHKHTPEAQLVDPLFSQFQSKAKMNGTTSLNIDIIPKYWNGEK